MSKVSVIIPVYNGAGFICDAIDSVFSQTFNDCEIIIVDDGSTDDLTEVLRKYNNRIKYFYQKNNGPAAARNKGISVSEGEHIAFLDADDIWLPTKLEKQIVLLESGSDIGFVYCDNYFVDADRKIIPDYSREIKLLEGDIFLDFFCRHFILTPAVILRKRCLDKIGLFNEGLAVGEDYDFFLRLAYLFKAGVVKEKLWERRILSNSLSRKDYIQDAMNDLFTLKNFIKQNPTVFLKNKKRILERLGDYHLKFAYSLLENGKNFKAFSQLILSARYHVSLKVLKNMMLCLLPFQLRKAIKEGMYAKS